jgi:hypothetical protein
LQVFDEQLVEVHGVFFKEKDGWLITSQTKAECCISNVGCMYYLNALSAILQTPPALMFIYG